MHIKVGRRSLRCGHNEKIKTRSSRIKLVTVYRNILRHIPQYHNADVYVQSTDDQCQRFPKCGARPPEKAASGLLGGGGVLFE
jgi:hypothetical protein